MKVQRILAFGLIALVLSSCNLVRTFAPFAQHVTFKYTVVAFDLTVARDAQQRRLDENAAAIAAADLDEDDRLTALSDEELEEAWRLRNLQQINRISSGATQITDEYRFPLCEAIVQDPDKIDFEVPSPGTAPQLGGVTLFATGLTTRDANPPVINPRPCNAMIRPSGISIVGAGETLGQPSTASTMSITMGGEQWTATGLHNSFEVSSYAADTKVGTGAFTLIAVEQDGNWQQTFTRYIAVTEGTFIAQE